MVCVMEKIIKNIYNKSYVATYEEVKKLEDMFDGCAICGTFENSLWFVLIEAGSGSMDDYICSDCIEKIQHIMEQEKKNNDFKETTKNE